MSELYIINLAESTSANEGVQIGCQSRGVQRQGSMGRYVLVGMRQEVRGGRFYMCERR